LTEYIKVITLNIYVEFTFSVYHSLDRATLSRSLGGIAHPSPEPVCTGSTSKPYTAAQVAFNAT